MKRTTAIKYAMDAEPGAPYPFEVAAALVADGQAPLFGDFEAVQVAKARARLQLEREAAEAERERRRAPLFEMEQ